MTPRWDPTYLAVNLAAQLYNEGLPLERCAGGLDHTAVLAEAHRIQDKTRLHRAATRVTTAIIRWLRAVPLRFQEPL